MSLHHEAGFEDSFLSGSTEWKSWELVVLLWAWASWGGIQASHPQSQPSPSPQTSQLSLQAPNICLPYFCRDGNRILKLVNQFWKRQESKMAHRGKQSSVRPGLVWAPGPHTVLISGGFPDKRRYFLLGFRLLLNPIQTLIKISCVTHSLLWAQLGKETGPHPNPINEDHLRQFPPLNENHKSSHSSLEPRLLTP